MNRNEIIGVSIIGAFTLIMFIECSCAVHLDPIVSKTGHPMRVCSLPSQIIIDDSLKSTAEIAIHLAVRNWNDRMQRQVFTFSEQPCKIYFWPVVPERDVVLGLTYFGNYDGCSGVIAIGLAADLLMNISDRRIIWVVEHELGHALGLAHRTDPQALMVPKAGRANAGFVSRDEVRLINHLQTCPDKALWKDCPEDL